MICSYGNTNAPPGQYPPQAVYDPRYIQIPGGSLTASPHLEIVCFWDLPDVSDVQYGNGTGDYGRGISTSVSGAYQTLSDKAWPVKRESRTTNDIANDNYYERRMESLFLSAVF